MIRKKEQANMDIVEDKTIGVLTFFEAKSHGALLQAFALKTIVEKQWYKCEFINYDRHFQQNANVVSCRSTMGKLKQKGITFCLHLDKHLHRRSYAKQENEISEFQKRYFNIGEKRYTSIKDLKKDPPSYDAYIVGSDQVWNPDTINQEAFYFTFLDFTKNTISYAPSLGVGYIKDDSVKLKMKKYLSHVKHLSCREDTGAKILSDITGREVTVVLDPTLLLKKDEWIELFDLKMNENRRYVLCYFLGSLSYGRNAAKKYAKENKMDIIYIVQNPIENFTVGNKQYGVSPIRFLQLLMNAEAVFTDSFHGTIFSINFNKEFYSFCRRDPYGQGSRISRLQSILKGLNIENRLIMPGDMTFLNGSKLNYTQIDACVERLRETSVRYLEKSINEV